MAVSATELLLKHKEAMESPSTPLVFPGVENAVIRSISWAIWISVWMNGDKVQDWCLGMIKFIHV